MPLLVGPVCLLRQGRFEEPVRPYFEARWSVTFKPSTLDLTQRGSLHAQDRSRWRQLRGLTTILEGRIMT